MDSSIHKLIALNNPIHDSIKSNKASMDYLKSQYSNLLSSSAASSNSVEMSQEIKNSHQKLHDALAHSEALLSISAYIDARDIEFCKLLDFNKRLIAESEWLRKELRHTQSQLEACELKVVQLEEANKGLQFKNELDTMLHAGQQNGSISTHATPQSPHPPHSSSATSNLNDAINYNLDQLFASDDEIIGGVHPANKTGGSATAAAALSNATSVTSLSGQSDDTNSLMTQSFMSTNATTLFSNGGGSGAASFEVPTRLRTLHNLVLHYAGQGRYEVAVPLCRQALEDLEKSTGTHDHPDVATMLNILALVYRNQGKLREATQLLHDALAIREKVLGGEHAAVAATLNNLAVLYGKRGRYKDAEPLCKRALLIRERLLGDDHPDVAKQLNNLALLCQNQAKYEEVEVYYQRALEIYSLKLGVDDANVTKTKNNLASAYLRQGKYRAAEQLYKEVVSRAHEQQLGGGMAARESGEEEQGDEGRSKNGTRAGGGGGAGGGLGPISWEHNPTIWMLAEQREAQKHAVSGHINTAAWERARRLDITPIMTTLKNLGALYRRQGKFDAAETVEEWVNAAKPQPQTQSQNSQVSISGGGGSGSAGVTAAKNKHINSDSQTQQFLNYSQT